MLKRCSLIAGLLLVTASQLPAAAQIVANPNDAGTIVHQNGNQFSIEGGTKAGKNLFHSFQQFGFTQEQTATFLSNPQIRTILGRVTGGEASRIDGLLRVVGGNSNLFLLNPAGIVFGANARLDVPASFTATTATAIGLDNQWFRAIGANNYAALTGTPNSFAFRASAGAIFNAGNLSVGAGQSLTLVGGTVVNTGTIAAPEGIVTIAAVPGEKLVRLTQQGSVLSLELPLETKSVIDTQPFHPIALPELLTGGTTIAATGVSVDNGVVTLTSTNLPIATGDVVAQAVTAQTATLAADRQLSVISGRIATTGDLNLLARQAIRIADSASSPVVIQAGAGLHIQGDHGITISALQHPASRLAAGGNMVLRSATPIQADAHYFVGGNLTFATLNGQAGDISSPNDPVILAAGDVTLDNYTGASLHILAGGSVTLGNVTINGTGTTDTSINPGNTTPINSTNTIADLATITRADGTPLQYNGTPSLASNGTLQWTNPTPLVIDGSTQPTLDVRAGIDWAALGGLPGDRIIDTVSPLPSFAATTSPATITTGKITVNPVSFSSNPNPGGVVLLTNQYRPRSTQTAADIRVNVNVTTTDASLATPGANNHQVIAIDAGGSVTIGPIAANGYPIPPANQYGPLDTLTGGGNSVDIRARNTITTGNLNLGSQSTTGNSSVKLVSTTGNVIVNTIASGANGIDIQAAGIFQAIGSFPASGSAGSVFTNLRTNAALRQFVLSKLPPGTVLTDAQLDTNYYISGELYKQPVSLLARPVSGRPQDSVNAPIRIRQGNGTRTATDRIDVYPSSAPVESQRTVGIITIQGDAAFNSGPVITPLVATPDKFVRRLSGGGYEEIPAISDPDALSTSLAFNQQYAALVFGSTLFPSQAGGTAGAIVIGGGTNGEFNGTPQGRVFAAVSTPNPNPNPNPKTNPNNSNNNSNGNSNNNSNGSSNGSSNGGNRGNTLNLTDQQTVQQDLASRSQAANCQSARTIASAPRETTTSNQPGDRAASAQSPSSAPCPPTQDDEQILQLLDTGVNTSQPK